MTHAVGTLIAASGLPLGEARALLAQALGVPRERLVAHPEWPVEDEQAAVFRAATRRRAAGEPLAYLIGEKEFFGRPFAVTPAVLVPRPETELLVEVALERLRSMKQPRVLDLGTGSGCVAVTLALENAEARLTATDLSEAALAVARSNAERLGGAVDFRHGDWYAAVPAGATYDLIVANPPYVAPGDPHLDALLHEPRTALTDGRDGLACLDAIVAGAPRHLAEGGWLMVEHGFDQSAAVQSLFRRAGLWPESRPDLAGHPRVTIGARREARSGTPAPGSTFTPV